MTDTPSTTTTHVPTPEECAALWSRFDVNGNGMLSLAELDKAVGELWPSLDHKPAVMRAYKAADRGGDGYVQKKEFQFFLALVHYYNQLWAHFEATDADGDRRLTRDEFRSCAAAALRGAGAPLALQGRDPDEVFDGMDSNHGGLVLFDEFCTWLARESSSG